MAELLKSQLLAGVWTGELTKFDVNDEFDIFLDGKAVLNVQAHTTDDKTVKITFPVPQWAFGDGVKNFILQTNSGVQLTILTLILGDAVTDDMRSEVGLLRAELDMLKKAFRQHVVQTMG